jgi:CspA family cold shock protein
MGATNTCFPEGWVVVAFRGDSQRSDRVRANTPDFALSETRSISLSRVTVDGMSAVGTVRVWHCEEGWGVIDSLDTPGGCWADFSHLCCVGTPEPGPGEVVRVSSEFLEAFEGAIVDFQWERANQHGYDFQATTLRVRERQPPHRLIRHCKAGDDPHF